MIYNTTMSYFIHVFVIQFLQKYVLYSSQVRIFLQHSFQPMFGYQFKLFLKFGRLRPNFKPGAENKLGRIHYFTKQYPKTARIN